VVLRSTTLCVAVSSRNRSCRLTLISIVAPCASGRSCSVPTPGMLIRPLESDFAILYAHCARSPQRVVRPDHSSDKALRWGGVSFWKTAACGGKFARQRDGRVQLKTKAIRLLKIQIYRTSFPSSSNSSIRKSGKNSRNTAGTGFGHLSCFRKPVSVKEQKQEDRTKSHKASPGSPQLAQREGDGVEDNWG
jgi:hypothetical protein